MLCAFSPLLASPNLTAFLYGDGSCICCALGWHKRRFLPPLSCPVPLWEICGRVRTAVCSLTPSLFEKESDLEGLADSFISFTEMINYESLWDFMSQSSSPNPWFHLPLQLIFYILEITSKVILLWRYVYILYYAYMVLTKTYICLKWIRKADFF